MSRLSRSHTRTSLVRSLLVAQKEKQKAELAPLEYSKKSPLKKWLLPFFLNAPPFPYNRKTLRPHVRVRPPFPISQQIPMSPLPRRRDNLYSHKKSSGGARAAVRKTSKKFNLVSLSYKVHISSSYAIFIFISYYV